MKKVSIFVTLLICKADADALTLLHAQNVSYLFRIIKRKCNILKGHLHIDCLTKNLISNASLNGEQHVMTTPVISVGSTVPISVMWARLVNI